MKCTAKNCANNAGCYPDKDNQAICQCNPGWMGDLCDERVPKANGFSKKKLVTSLPTVSSAACSLNS